MKPLLSSLNYTREWEEAIFLLRLPSDFFWIHVTNGLPSTKTFCISKGPMTNVKKTRNLTFSIVAKLMMV